MKHYLLSSQSTCWLGLFSREIAISKDKLRRQLSLASAMLPTTPSGAAEAITWLLISGRLLDSQPDCHRPTLPQQPIADEG
jgi:hypothetical protein